jgi:hypothetical protein
MKAKILIGAAALAFASVALAQANGTITNGTNSNAQQAVNVNNTVAFPSGGESDVNYNGSYTVKSAPTVYAPSLTASVTETCWGSVSGAVSVVGVGATAAATIKDEDCNRRLNAAVAWRMDRKDVAFNIMCQEQSFREAAADTDHPCNAPKAAQAKAPIPEDKAVLVPVPNVPNVLQYRVADTPPPAPAK